MFLFECFVVIHSSFSQLFGYYGTLYVELEVELQVLKGRRNVTLLSLVALP